MDQPLGIRKGSFAQRIRSLVGDSLAYGLADVSMRMLNVLILPVIVRVLEIGEYAVVDGLNVFKGLVLSVALMGLDQAAIRLGSQYNEDHIKKGIVGQALCTALLIAGAITLLLIIVARPAVSFMFGVVKEEYVLAARLMLASIPLTVFVTFARTALKWNFERKRFIGLSIGYVGGSLLLALILVGVLHLGVSGVFYAQILVELVVVLVAGKFCARYVTFPRSLNYVREMLSFGLPLMFVGVLYNLIPWGERILVVRLLGLDTMGLYAVGQKFARLIRIPTGGFSVAWGPFAYAMYREPDAELTFNKVLFYYSLALASMGLALVVIAKPALLLFASDKYSAALCVLVPLVFAFVIESVGEITGLGVNLSKRTSFLMIAYLVSLGVMLMSAIFLAKHWGLVGVAYGVLFGSLALTISQTVAAYLVYGLRFKLAASGAILAGAIGIAWLVERFLWA